ncbi:hypothetical protein E2562_010380 [Oryza meyeriana var. granulata]|uniref:Uncharacterized protein n=1 Tax=Oryza meyeriana var. granulata TaxID=110450 RepID=A0A6G1F6J1_9ORYZ|nr:hypothetical protein E2562_010380 [Oryza meyeriana var. granulata]
MTWALQAALPTQQPVMPISLKASLHVMQEAEYGYPAIDYIYYKRREGSGTATLVEIENDNDHAQ